MKFKIFAGIGILSLSVSGVYAASPSTVRQLIQAGKSVQCIYTKTDAYGTQNGTFLVANRKVRGDMTFLRAGSAPVLTHMIQDSDWSYMWGGPFGEQQGSKINVSTLKAQTASSPRKNSFDMDKKMDMDCKPWTVSDAQFMPPSNVQFHDITQQVQQGMSQRMMAPGGNAAGNPCAACDQAPPDARAQCRQALNCH